MSISISQLQFKALQKTDKLNTAINSVIKNLREEGYTEARLRQIISNEIKYQQYHKKRFPNSELPTGTIACLKACEILMTRHN